MIYQGSRYTNTQLYDRDGALMFKIRKPIYFGGAKAVTHTFCETDRLDILATKYYGNPQLYWVILEANKQYRCELDINIGDTLIIPDYEEVRKCLNL